MTMLEKVPARACGRDAVRVGEILECQVDQVVQVDMSFTLSELVPTRVKAPERVTSLFDHAIPAPSIRDADGMVAARRFAEKFGIKLYDVGKHGICHQLIMEKAIALPGTLLACSDSHTCAAGALNCAARGLGDPEILHVMCKGTTWYILYPTVLFELEGSCKEFVFGKDVLFYIADRYGDFPNRNIEFNGVAVEEMDVEERHSLSTKQFETLNPFVLRETMERKLATILSTHAPNHPLTLTISSGNILL